MTKQLAHNDFLFVTGEQADGRDGRGWGDVGKVSLGRSEKWGWHKKEFVEKFCMVSCVFALNMVNNNIYVDQRRSATKSCRRCSS